MLNAQLIKDKAREYGAALVGIGDISRWADAPAQRDPKQILPNATCVIGMAIRVPRALYRVMESREQYANYTQLGVLKRSFMQPPFFSSMLTHARMHPPHLALL